MKGKVFLRCCFSKFSSYQERVRERRWYIKMADRKSCDQCPKTFASGSGLYNHKQTHSGVKRHNCYQCKKSFNQAVHLKTHFQIHTGEKPHKCNQCNFSSNQASNLREHLRKHTGEKLTNAINAISLQLLQAIWRRTKGPTLGKSLRDAQLVSFQHYNWWFKKAHDDKSYRRKAFQL